MRWRAAIAGVVSLAGGTLVAPAIPVVAAVPADPSPAGEWIASGPDRVATCRRPPDGWQRLLARAVS